MTATPEQTPMPAEPPVRRGVGHAERRVGVEIEFGGLDAATAARVLAGTIGGEVRTISAQEYVVESPAHGAFRVELDARWSHPDFVAEHLGDVPPEWREGLDVRIAGAVAAVAGQVMPVEIVAPPVPWHDLGLMNGLCHALAAAGARGTAHSAFAGFGMHLNVEAVSLDAPYLLRMLRAYVILSQWLRRESRLATIRQVQSYIDPFPIAYAHHILAPDYEPDEERLIRDHLSFNPSRDYELDMLPIFATIDADLVESLLPGQKNSPRPTFHWRLPNCRLDEPVWDPLDDWSRWVAVERLAHDEAALAAEAERFLKEGPQSEFAARMGRIMDALGLDTAVPGTTERPKP
ncbi:MAG: amidoligase family protein [Paracoccaceae bacterium]